MLFESAQQSLKAIRSLPSYEQMVLQPFTTAEVQQYMRVALDRQNISDHVAGAVRERTGGLPLYVEQVTLPTITLDHGQLCMEKTGYSSCHANINIKMP